MSPTYDVILVADTRSAAGGIRAIESEVRAQAAAGYSTAIYPVFSDAPVSGAMDPSIQSLVEEGSADLLLPGERAGCRLLIARNPGAFMSEQSVLPRISAERQVFVVDELPRSSMSSTMALNPKVLEEAVQSTFAGDWEWAPVSPIVRAAMDVAASDLALTPRDWFSTIDLNSWFVPRDFGDSILKIGRHSRDLALNWPDTAREIHAAYPTDPRFRVVAMGGLKSASAVLGMPPLGWRSIGFDEMPVSAFLSRLHIYSYFHHSDWVEAFGFKILEAMASGLPCVLPTYLSETFGENAAVFCDSALDTGAVYEELYGDRDRLSDLSSASVQVVRDRFSPAAHIERVADLIGPSGRPPLPETPSSPSGSSGETNRPNVIFFTDNGHGLGHLTRSMAVAKKADGRFNPVFLTMSTGFPLLREAGFPVEYFPSYTKLKLSPAQWDPLFTSRITEMIRMTRARVVVVDHVGPPDSFGLVRARSSGVEFIWCRRGLWREGRNQIALAKTSGFDLIVEPGDISGPVDMGLTAERREKVISVSPVVLLDQSEQLGREESRAELGIPGEGTAVLIQLSDSSPKKLQQMIHHAMAVAKDVVGTTLVHFFAPLHALLGQNMYPVEGVEMRSVYPVARYLSAFDGVISTAGYNSYHEVVASGVPAVFVARDTQSVDDQQRRASFAELSGRAFWASSVYDDKFEDAVRGMLEPGESDIAVRVTAELGEMNGASEFADIIANRCDFLSGDPFSVESILIDQEARSEAVAIMDFGGILPQSSQRLSEVVVIVALEHDTTQLSDLAEEVARWQNVRLSFKAVFLVRDIIPVGLDVWDFAFETVMNEEAWSGLGVSASYTDYLRDRIAGARTRYGADRQVVAIPESPLRKWLLP